MAIAGLNTPAIAEIDHFAIAAAPARLFDDAIGGRIDRLAGSAGHIDTRVHHNAAVERIVADTEVAGHRKAYDRLQRRNRKHRLLQRVDLRPACEQLPERPIAVPTGSASCRERVWQYVDISVARGTLKKK